MAKYQARCVYVRSVPGFLAGRLRAQHLYGVSVFLFIVQLAFLPRRARQIEAAFLRVRLPKVCIATGILGCTSAAMRNRFIPAEVHACATMLRYALTTSELDGYREGLVRLRESDVVSLAAPSLECVREGVLQRLRRVRREALGLPPRIVERAKNAKTRIMEQAKRRGSAQQPEGEGPTRRKLEEIEDRAMAETDPDKLGKLTEEYREEYMKERAQDDPGEQRRICEEQSQGDLQPGQQRASGSRDAPRHEEMQVDEVE